MSCASPTVVQCKPAADLAALVRSYKMHNLHNLRGDLDFFRDMPSLECAVHHAGLAINSNGKRFRHQCRIPLAVLRHAKALLGSSETQLKGRHSFCDLCSLISSIFEPVRGLGQLYSYDTALRLGAFLNLSPEHVYLHAGTRTGARALGLNVAARFLEVAAFPKPIQALEPCEIEDFLCIYKDRLAR